MKTRQNYGRFTVPHLAPQCPSRTLPARRGRKTVYAIYPPFAEPIQARGLTPGEIGEACILGCAIGGLIMLAICRAIG